MARHDTTDNKRGAYGKTASVTWACSKRCLYCKREVDGGLFPREPTDFFREIPCDFILGHAPDNLAARHLNSVGGVAYKAIARSLTEKSRGISWKYSVDNFTGLAQRGVAMNPTDSRDFRKCVGAFRTRAYRALNAGGHSKHSKRRLRHSHDE